MTRLRRIVLVLGVLYAIGVLLIAFWPTPVDAGFRQEIDWFVARVQRLGWQSFDYDRLESLGNVILFLPFGFLASVLLRAREWWAAVVLGVVASGVIETGQFLFLDTRFATLHDVAMNGLGTAIGVAAGLFAHAVVRGTARVRLAHAVRAR